MKTIYIIGNGFDKEHGLATGYLDFYNYLLSDRESERFLYDMIDAYGAYGYDWWSNFEESLGDGFWFEMEFESMAESVIENMVTDDGEEMFDIESALEAHWESYYRFMENLNNYVYRWIDDTIDVTHMLPKVKSLIDSQDYFMNFNYTNVLEKVYKINGSHILHVHGSVDDRKNIIMGHGNVEAIEEFEKRREDAQKKLDKNRETVYAAIASFYKATLKDVNRIIRLNDYFFNKLHSVGIVKVYGHSLGKVDLPYFKKIKSCVLPNAEWYFYAYHESGEELSSAKKKIRDDIKELHLNAKHVHIISYKNFLK